MLCNLEKNFWRSKARQSKNNSVEIFVFPSPENMKSIRKIIFFMIYIRHSEFFASGDPYKMLFLAQQRSAPARSSFCAETLLVIPLLIAQASEREKAFFILQLSSKRTLSSVSAARAFSSLAMASLPSVRRAARRAGSASWACFSS